MDLKLVLSLAYVMSDARVEAPAAREPFQNHHCGPSKEAIRLRCIWVPWTLTWAFDPMVNFLDHTRNGKGSPESPLCKTSCLRSSMWQINL